MPDRNLSFKISATDDVSTVTKKLASNVKADMANVDTAFSDSETKGKQVAAALSATFDTLDADLTATKTAADALATALGDTGSKIDASSAVGELQRLGLSLDEIEADADALAAALKKADDVSLKHFGGEADVAAGNLRRFSGEADGAAGNIKRVHDSSDQSRSVLANLVGNSIQDMGALGGVAGSAGVAIGQLGEYAADGNISLGSLTKLAGPMAVLGVATMAVSGAMQAASESRAFDAANVKQYSDALKEGQSATESFNDEIRETGELQFRSQTGGGPLGMFASTKDLLPTLDEAGIKVAQFNQIVEQFATKTTSEWVAGLEAAGLSDLEAIRIIKAAKQEHDSRTEAVERAARVDRLLGTEAEVAASKIDDLAAAGQLGEGAIAAMGEATAQAMVQQEGLSGAVRIGEGAIAAMGEATAQAMTWMQEFQRISTSSDWGASAFAGAQTAASQMTEMLFAQSNMAQQDEEAFAALKTSVADNGKTFDQSTQAGRDNMDALEGVSVALEDDLASAYQAADGDADTFKRNATEIATKTLTRLQTELGLSDEETQVLGHQLGLLPEDIETRYKLSQTEEARTKIGLLQGAIEALPKDVQAKVTQQIIAGDYVGAVNTIQTYNNNHPTSVETDSRAGDTAAGRNAVQSYNNSHPTTVRVDSIVGRQRSDNSQVVGEDGLILSSFAAGGSTLPDQARIQPPGTLVQWAEPGTGGEAFIPLAASKEPRSEAIWQQVGRMKGWKAFAAGGFSGGEYMSVAGAPNVVYNITIRQLPGQRPKDVVAAIKEYERTAGTSWRR